MNERYYKYLDNVLLQSKFRIDLFLNGTDILYRKFPDIKHRKEASGILIDWISTTDPYERLQNGQIGIFDE
jgi:hypothetical protein